MENKMVKVPLDLELAKKITSGEVEGRVITRLGRDARIVCFDYKGETFNIIALLDFDSYEQVEYYLKNGMWMEEETDDLDLMLEIPEYLTFKDGDIITCGWEIDGEFCKWISIFNHRNDDCNIDYYEYVSIILESSLTIGTNICFGQNCDSAKWARYSTEEEVKMLIEELNKSDNTDAKDILQKFFPNEINTQESSEKTVWIKGSLPQENEEVIILIDVNGKILPHVVKFRERFNNLDGKFVFGCYPVIAYCKMPSYEEFKK